MINLNRFDLISLRLFIAVVDAGSLTAGAVRYGISLAAASKRITELELHCESSLLERSARGVTPTAAGQTLYRHAIGLIAQLEQMALAIGDFKRGSSGHLRLWANTSAFNGFLPELLARYSAAHPGVTIDLEDALSEDAARAVATGAAELGVIGENTPTEGLETMLCDVDELVLVVPKDHPLANSLTGSPRVAFNRALDHDFVGLARATSLMRQINHAAETERKALRIRVQVRSFDAVCRMVAVGLGVAILPRAGAAPHVASLGIAIVQIDGFNTTRRLMLAMRSRALLSPAAEALVAMVAERVR